MCGIFGYAGKRKDAAKVVLKGLKTLEYRGYDSWGIAAVPAESSKTQISNPKNQKTIFIKKQIGKIGSANVDDFPQSSLAFGHTRWATHGGVTAVNAHPHLDCTGNLALIHNGIIENYEEKRKALKKLKHRFVSDTDTEVAIHLIEEYATNQLSSKAMQKAFNELTGLNAFILLSSPEKKLVIARNGSPLVVGYGDGENFIASDPAAILPYTRQVHFLQDNEMAIVSDKGIMVFDAVTGDLVEVEKQHLDYTPEQVVLGKYPHYMLKEIHEQPAILSSIAAIDTTPAKKIADIIKTSRGTYMVGCGTASYACLAGSYLFSMIAKRHVNWALGSEFSYQLDFLTDTSLVIALSQSGETMDTLVAVHKAKEKNARVFALVNVEGSQLYRESDDTLVIGAGPEIAVASTKAFTGKLAHLLLLSYAMAGDVSDGQKILLRAIKSSKKILSPPTGSKIQKLGSSLKDAEHIFIIGRGLSYPASLEIALKIKEISYIHAEGIAAGELKHGPLAMVEKGTPCIVIAPNDNTIDAVLAGAMEMKARGGYIIGFSNKHHEVFDTFIPIPDSAEASIIPTVIAGQLLAYEIAVAKGLDPDKPRNLAKSVTVK